MDPVLVQVVLVGAFAGFIQGLSGFAFALVATSLLAWTIEPQLLVPAIVVTSLLGQTVSLVSVRKEVKLVRATPFLFGGAVGVPFGVLILPLLNSTAFKLSVGITLVLYCSIMLRTTTLPVFRRGGNTADSVVGLIAGIMGGATGISGPPIILWCALRGWDKDVQRATFQPFIIGTQILTIVIFLAGGLITARVMQLFLMAALPIILSSWIGSRVFKQFKNQDFQNVIFGLLLLSGLTLVLKSL